MEKSNHSFFKVTIILFILGISLFTFFLVKRQNIGKFFIRTRANKFNDVDKNLVGFLQVVNDKIVDARGNKVYLRGFQGIGTYSIPDEIFVKAFYGQKADTSSFDMIAKDLSQYALTDFDIAEIKSTGANVVRIWTLVHEIKRGENQYSEVALKILEDSVNRFGKEGIYSIIVLAGAGENNYEPQQIYLDHGVNLWDPKSSARQDSIDVWEVLSQRFENNTYVAGYDVINEPMPQSPQALHSYFTDLIMAIRKHDKNHIIILPVAQANRDTWQIGGEYDDENIVVTFHFYEPHDFTLEPTIANQTYPGTYKGKYWDKAAIEKAFEYAVNLPQLKGKPIYIGEFGADGSRDGQGGLEWTRDVLEVMNKYGLHYTYHNYKHKVHQGYWYKKPEALAASRTMIDKLISGQISYDEITTDQKRKTFSTEYSSLKRVGIKEILSEAFKMTNISLIKQPVY